MYSNFYEGSVPMIPDMEKKDFVGEDDFVYQMPTVCFECVGQVYDPKSVFEWGEDSVVVIKGNRIVKYTESKFFDALVRNVDGNAVWLEGRAADVLGYFEEDVEDRKERTTYKVEEFDCNKAEKRVYQVVLKESSHLDPDEYHWLSWYIDGGKCKEGPQYTLTEE